MAPIALFGIENGGLNLAVNLLVLALVVVWVALVYWTYSDARRRITDPMLVGCATAASLFPFIGTIVYLIVRPPEYLDDVHERELEIAAAEARLSSVRQHTCPHCDFEIEPTLPALPQLPPAPQGAVHRVRQAARPALEDLPLLRGRGGPGARPAAPPRTPGESRERPGAPGAGPARRGAAPAAAAAASSRPAPAAAPARPGPAAAAAPGPAKSPAARASAPGTTPAARRRRHRRAPGHPAAGRLNPNTTERTHPRWTGP